MIHRVLGFAFDSMQDYVVLINKKRPVEQAGYWNGIGGHCNINESWAVSMSREFEEETGCIIHSDNWTRAASLHRDSLHLLHIFYTHVHIERLRAYVHTVTDEEVQIFSVSCLNGDSYRYHLVPDCRWLLELCQSFRLGERAKGFVMREEQRGSI